MDAVLIDIQSQKKNSRFAITRCGVVNIKQPLKVVDTSGADSVAGAVPQSVVADMNLSVSIEAEDRGTHMSRFMELLSTSFQETPIDLDRLADLTLECRTKLEAPDAEVSVSFDWFREVAAPVTGKSALMDYQVALSCTDGTRTSRSMTIRVPAKALCPCSKAISDRGAHNQRSLIKAKVTMDDASVGLSIGRLIEMLETSASSPVYPILKREDEKFITEQAYDNPTFVEDIVRNAAEKLYDCPGIASFEVEAINQESIHNHDCFARIEFNRSSETNPTV